MALRDNNIKIGIVSSPGGHLYIVNQFRDWWIKYKRFWVTGRPEQQYETLNKEKVYIGFFPENRNKVNFFRNLLLAIKILRKEKPDILFSTGAGIAPPFYIIGKIMGIKLIFMEAYVFSEKPTLSGKIVYYLSDFFIVQNRELLKYYPKAKYLGNIT